MDDSSADRPAECQWGHPLTWLTDKFVLCRSCDLLFVKQPGCLVWIYDRYAKQLADELDRCQRKSA